MWAAIVFLLLLGDVGAQIKVGVFEEVSEFLVFNKSLNFDAAVAGCEEVDATLARISTRLELEFVANLVIDSAVQDAPFWIGS